jgi:hypothetical protein
MTVGRPCARTRARELGFRVANKEGRLSFKKGTSGHEIVHKMWMQVERARTGGKGYGTRQPFKTIEDIVNMYGGIIWRKRDRRHLLLANEEPEYTEELYWDQASHRVR